MRYRKRQAKYGELCCACQKQIEANAYEAPDGLTVCGRDCAEWHHANRDGFTLAQILRDVLDAIGHPDADPVEIAQGLGLASQIADIVPLNQCRYVIEHLSRCIKEIGATI